MVTRSVAISGQTKRCVAIKSPRTSGFQDTFVREIILHRALGKHKNIIGLLETIKTTTPPSSSRKNKEGAETAETCSFEISSDSKDLLSSDTFSSSEEEESSSESEINTLHLVFELCEMDLVNYIETTSTTIRLLDFKKIYDDLTTAVRYIHDKDIVHRDIKPNNILMSWDGSVSNPPVFKLADFGMAVFLLDTCFLELDCACWSYRSPDLQLITSFDRKEICISDKIILKAGDVWALGVSLVEVLTGRMVVQAPTKEDAINAMCKKMSMAYEKYPPLLKDNDKLSFLLKSTKSQICVNIESELGKLRHKLHSNTIEVLESLLFYSPYLRVSNFQKLTQNASMVQKRREDIFRLRLDTKPPKVRVLVPHEHMFLVLLLRAVKFLKLPKVLVYLVSQTLRTSERIWRSPELSALSVMMLRTLHDNVQRSLVSQLLLLLKAPINTKNLQNREYELADETGVFSNLLIILESTKDWTIRYRRTKSVYDWLRTIA